MADTIFPPPSGVGSVVSTDITDSTAYGRALLTAASVSAQRSALGLGSASQSDTSAFEPAGSISALSSIYQPLDSDLTAIAALSTTTYGRALLALADAATGRTALGLAGLSTDANGVASLNGTAAAYRAYGPNGVPYATLLHDGTNGILQPSAGDMILRSPTGTTNLGISGTNYVGMKGGIASGYVGYWSVSDDNFTTVRGRYQANIGLQIPSDLMLAFTSSTSATGTRDAGVERVGVNIIGLNNGTSVASTGQYGSLYTGSQRAYDSTKAKYLVMEHNGSYGDIYTSANDLMLRAANSGSYIQVRSGDWYWNSAGTGIFYMSSNGTSLASGKQYGFSSGSTGGTNDTAIARNSAGVLEINNGTAGAYRDLNLRTLTTSGSASLNGMTAGGYSIRSSTGTALYLVGSSSGVEIGNYGSALATVKPNSANSTTELQYFLTSNTAIKETSAGVAEINNGTSGTLRDLRARSVFSIAQAATDTPGCDKGAASQSANLREWQDSTGAVLSTVSENGYFTTRKNAAPADAEIATGEAAYWFDSTNGAAKFMIKAKQADGTVVTGSVTLA